MYVASLVIALVALGLSVFNTVTAYRRGIRAEERETRAEERAILADQRSQQTRLDVRPDEISGGPGASTVHWQYMVRNTGHTAARGVRLWHADRDTGQPVTGVAGDDHLSLAPGEPIWMGLDGPPRSGADTVIMVAWEDDAGPHERETGTPRPHA